MAYLRGKGSTGQATDCHVSSYLVFVGGVTGLLAIAHASSDCWAPGDERHTAAPGLSLAAVYLDEPVFGGHNVMLGSAAIYIWIRRDVGL